MCKIVDVGAKNVKKWLGKQHQSVGIPEGWTEPILDILMLSPQRSKCPPYAMTSGGVARWRMNDIYYDFNCKRNECGVFDENGEYQFRTNGKGKKKQKNIYMNEISYNFVEYS